MYSMSYLINSVRKLIHYLLINVLPQGVKNVILPSIAVVCMSNIRRQWNGKGFWHKKIVTMSTVMVDYYCYYQGELSVTILTIDD